MNLLCPKGHESLKFSITGECEVCKSNEESKKYVKNHKDRILLTKAKNRAKRKGLEFNIDITDVVIPKKCPILGIDIITDVSGKYTHNSPSIDRIDNDRGYIKGNVRVISHRANALKGDATLEELKMVVENFNNL
jgi:hypothetical protein